MFRCYSVSTSIHFTFCRTWKFKDLCLTATFPSFDEAIFDRVRFLWARIWFCVFVYNCLMKMQCAAFDESITKQELETCCVVWPETTAKVPSSNDRVQQMEQWGSFAGMCSGPQMALSPSAKGHHSLDAWWPLSGHWVQGTVRHGLIIRQELMWIMHSFWTSVSPLPFWLWKHFLLIQAPNTTVHFSRAWIFFQLLENLLPCIVITPLDCFWEGSKILGPIHGLFVPWVFVHFLW